jgi:predicted DNA-binding transcriptional regulator AlpA
MRTPVTIPIIPPRGLNIKQAASYWGVSRGTFLKLVDLGIAPQPLNLGVKRSVYDRLALDAAMTARAVKA